MAIGIGVGIPFGSKASWSSYWTNTNKILFWGKVNQISGGQMPNIFGTDYLTVGGTPGSYTFQCPNNATYIAADTDYIWFKTNTVQRTTTTAELIGYDLPRTPVKYGNESPNTLTEIMILKAGATLTTDEIDKLHQYMQLSIWWSGAWNDYGYPKDNRTGQQLWTPESVTTLLDNIIGYWKLDEASGNAIDEVASLDGTPLNVTYSVAGKIGTAFRFVNASGSSLNMGAVAGITTHAVSLWAKRIAVLGGARFLYGVKTNWAGIAVNNAGDVLFVNTAGSVLATWAGVFADSTAFHHIVVITSVIGDATHGKIELYFDGISQGEKTCLTYNPEAFTIGCQAALGGNFDGDIDEVGLWSTLTPEEVVELNNSGSGNTYPFN